MMDLFRGGTRRAGVSLDPRTKLALMFIVTTVLVTGSRGPLANLNRLVLTMLPLALLALAGNRATTFRFTVVYAIAYGVEFVAIPRMDGTIGFVLVAVTGIVTRMIPALTMGRYLFASTTVSEFTAAMERMRMPQAITIPFSVMFRFFPTIAEEARAINDAMRMRGVNPLSLEYRVVPLMMNTVKIGEELSAAALTRGLGGPTRRTNVCEIGLGLTDLAFAVPALACLVIHIFRL